MQLDCDLPNQLSSLIFLHAFNFYGKVALKIAQSGCYQRFVGTSYVSLDPNKGLQRISQCLEIIKDEKTRTHIAFVELPLEIAASVEFFVRARLLG